MIDGKRVGVGIVTCNRPEFLHKLMDSLLQCDGIADYVIVINDGDFLDPTEYIKDSDMSKHGSWINNEANLGVARSKNLAMKHLRDDNCDHIFIIEDDMLIKRKDIFEAYINASKISGIDHMMFGYHGPANKNNISKGKPVPRLIVDYGDFKIALNRHCVGAFCYYTKESLEKCGLIDERFKNAFDHVSHSYTLAQNGYSTPYWWWSDLANSTDYIEEQACSEESSSIKTPEKMKEWSENINNSMKIFETKFGVAPFGPNGVPDISEKDVLEFIKLLKP